MITRRDLTVALLAIVGTASLASVVSYEKPMLGSAVYEWNTIPVTKTSVGEVRQFLRGPTTTLDELEVHVTTLNQGETSHPPHRHPDEELVIVKEGTLEALVNGEWKRVGAGSVIFNASNQLHGLRNIGKGTATYHVINWSSPGMLSKQAQQ